MWRKSPWAVTRQSDWTGKYGRNLYRLRTSNDSDTDCEEVKATYMPLVWHGHGRFARGEVTGSPAT